MSTKLVVKKWTSETDEGETVHHRRVIRRPLSPDEEAARAAEERDRQNLTGSEAYKRQLDDQYIESLRKIDLIKVVYDLVKLQDGNTTEKMAELVDRVDRARTRRAQRGGI